MAEEIQEETPLPAPGVKLKMRREALNLSIEDIADKLHLRPSVVAELESDVIDHNISMTFTRGYIRLYARHLELDPDPLLAEFDELANPVKQPAKLQSFSQKVAKQASDARLMMFTWFVLFVIVAMAVVWWFQQPDTGSTTTTATSSQAQDVGSVGQPAETTGNNQETNAQQPIETFAQPDLRSADEPETIESSEVNSGVQAVSEIKADERDNITTDTVDFPETAAEQNFSVEPADNGVTIESGENSESVVVAPEETSAINSTELQTTIDESLTIEESPAIEDSTIAEAAEASAAAGIDELQTLQLEDTEIATAEPVELIFTFSEDCWMNLTDATGEAIAYGIKAAGRVMPVSGVPPFEVKLGAPQAVSLMVDGVPFDMSGFPAGRTATFTIGAE
ncbi:RodZ domain-containing protein [Planctobacterium marinum]|uniref:Membrane protein n=1 Tax=Planctobacterium marinum TaxID=1631968 RepID=A0AA48HN47_9ALTE|nr:membrane protein [Planctobacterium marinum]